MGDSDSKKDGLTDPPGIERVYGIVAPNMIGLVTKIIKPDDGKGMVPPSLVQLPVPAPPSPAAQPSTPSVPGFVPPNVVPPVQGQSPQPGNPPTK